MAENSHISFDRDLEALQPITLEEMKSVKLMNRVDAKFLTDEATLRGVLADAAAAGYRVLVTEGQRQSPYDSVYFDTPQLRMFYDHRNKHLVRQKVRTRCYVRSGQAFLEIKRKNNHGRTSKKRTELPVADMKDFSANQDACAYLARHSWFTQADLSPVLETLFTRITLVNPSLTERLTIDTQLQFKNFRTQLETTLQDAVVIELKQDGRASSQMRNIFLEHRIKPVRVSKYCIAVTLTDPGAISGRFKMKVRAIEKTMGKKIETK
jgi:hypothetical protein